MNCYVYTQNRVLMCCVLLTAKVRVMAGVWHCMAGLP